MGHRVQIGQGSFRKSRLKSCSDQDIQSFANGMLRPGMGGEDNGIAGLNSDHGLVNRGGNRAGGRTESNDDSYRNPHIHGFLLGILPDDSNAVHPSEICLQVLADKSILNKFVLPSAIIRFLTGHHGQVLGMFFNFLGHVLHYRIQFFLRKGSQDFLGLAGIFRKDPGFLDGEQVIIDNIHF